VREQQGGEEERGGYAHSSCFSLLPKYNTENTAGARRGAHGAARGTTSLRSPRLPPLSYLLDLLWNKYWVATLSASPLIANRDFAAGQVGEGEEKGVGERVWGGGKGYGRAQGEEGPESIATQRCAV
jgi:hypothetical protein